MTRDEEDILDDIETLLKAQLNTNIAAIEAAKVIAGKGITGGLASIEATSYYRQSWDDRILNTSPSIYYGIEDVGSKGVGPGTVRQVKVFVEAVVVDSNNDGFANSRVLRYARAIREVFEQNYAMFAEGKTIIETVRPTSFKLGLDSSEELKVGGVSLTTVLA